MKVIKNSTSNEISLPFIRLDTTELLDLIRLITGPDTPTIKIGDYASSEIIELDGIVEIQENSHILKIPMEIIYSNVSIKIKKNYATISWTVDDSIRARHAAEAFKPHVPWFNFMSKDRSYYPLYAAVALWPVFNSFDLTGGELFATQFSLMSVFMIFLFSTKSIVSKNRIYYLPKGTFYRRNRDAILMLIIGTVLGVIVTQAAPAIYDKFISDDTATGNPPVPSTKK